MPDNIPKIVMWEDRPISELSREELIEALTVASSRIRDLERQFVWKDAPDPTPRSATLRSYTFHDGPHDSWGGL